MKTNQPVRVSKAVSGRGVFAAQSFLQDQPIAMIRGAVIHDPDYTSSYCIDLGRHLSLEPAAPFRFLNHSCTPNSEIVLRDGDGHEAPSAWLHALRKIRTDEELTIDYAWPAEDTIPCTCGSRRCRGWIVHKDDLALVS